MQELNGVDGGLQRLTDKNEAEIDFGAIRLPTDDLTIGNLRKREAKLFGDPDGRRDEYRLGSMRVFQAVAAEMDFAEHVSNRALGRRDRIDPDLADRRTFKHDLMLDYEELGIGEGEASRRELIEQLERDAIALAQRACGR